MLVFRVQFSGKRRRKTQDLKTQAKRVRCLRTVHRLFSCVLGLEVLCLWIGVMSGGMSGSSGSGGFGRSRSGGGNQADGMKWACGVMVMAWWERCWCPWCGHEKARRVGDRAGGENGGRERVSSRAGIRRVDQGIFGRRAPRRLAPTTWLRHTGKAHN